MRKTALIVVLSVLAAGVACRRGGAESGDRGDRGDDARDQLLGVLDKPPGPVYVEVSAELEGYRGVLERAARRDDEVLADPATPIRVVSARQVPAGTFQVALELKRYGECYRNETNCSGGGCIITFCDGIDETVAMHELGHVMGLGHHSGVGLMGTERDGIPTDDWTEQEVWAVRPEGTGRGATPGRTGAPACAPNNGTEVRT